MNGDEIGNGISWVGQLGLAGWMLFYFIKEAKNNREREDAARKAAEEREDCARKAAEIRDEQWRRAIYKLTEQVATVVMLSELASAKQKSSAEEAIHDRERRTKGEE